MSSGFSNVDMTPYYRYHLFFCLNQRESGAIRPCCGGAESERLFSYAKSCIKGMCSNVPRQVRVSKSGCMGRCNQGPVMVIYPEGIWYTYASFTDVEKIIHSHIMGGHAVNRLRLI